jgi:hypothetical protein
VAQDQQVLSFILSSLLKETLAPIATKTTAAATWREIEGLFSSQMGAHTVNTRLALTMTQKGQLYHDRVLQQDAVSWRRDGGSWTPP